MFAAVVSMPGGMGRADPKAGSLPDGSQQSDHCEPATAGAIKTGLLAAYGPRAVSRRSPWNIGNTGGYPDQLAEIYARFIGEPRRNRNPTDQRNELT
jgi:hypothetical protein